MYLYDVGNITHSHTVQKPKSRINVNSESSESLKSADKICMEKVKDLLFSYVSNVNNVKFVDDIWHMGCLITVAEK